MTNISKELAGWKIGRRLGKGACGGVYEATKDGVEGACKLAQFKDVLKNNEIDYTNLIANESNFLSRTESLHIPYLPQMYQSCATKDGWTFIVIEKFGQGSLVEYAKRNGALSVPFVCGIGWRLVKCLQAIHGAGWFHLDIKPGNAMIADDPRRGIVLIDFGLSLPATYTKTPAKK